MLRPSSCELPSRVGRGLIYLQPPMHLDRAAYGFYCMVVGAVSGVVAVVLVLLLGIASLALFFPSKVQVPTEVYGMIEPMF